MQRSDDNVGIHHLRGVSKCFSTLYDVQRCYEVAFIDVIYVCVSSVKPATGRPYVRAFSLSGTVPAFTCDCLRFVCAFTPRPKVDLCVSTSSRTMLAFGNNVSFSSSACSTLAFCRR